MKSPNHDRAKVQSILLILALFFAGGARACGPNFPNSMLDRGDEALLAAPQSSFYSQVGLLPLPRSKFKAHPTDDFAAEAAAADAADLARALKEKKTTPEKRMLILRNFQLERAKLTRLRVQLNEWKSAGLEEWVNGEWVRHSPKPRPTLESVDLSLLAGAPVEFVDYLQGSMAWFGGETNLARSRWETLLRLPAEERHYRSTWAAYMIGKSWAAENPETAAGWFQQVRAFQTNGFADSIGLAAASLGEEGRVRLNQKNFEAALTLYLAQEAAHGNAADSLSITCARIFDQSNGDSQLPALAANPATRRVINAYLTAGDHDDSCNRWLAAVEMANVTDVPSAEQLALAAYQSGHWDAAQRWINRAPKTPTAQWLQAKLLLRAGKTKAAAVLLHRLADVFPPQLPEEPDAKIGGLQDTLYMTGSRDLVSAHNQIQAEIGVLKLTRREYAESLDALLRSGFWMDAAYVAERVLTAHELQTYVDQNWPANTNAANENIRYLLARRLARDGKLEIARAYFPAAQLTNYDAMVRSLDASGDTNAPNPQRAQSYVDAAFVFRTNGMELLGTEIGPDWHVYDGGFTDFYDPVEMRQPTNSTLSTASRDETKRSEDSVDPKLRFHYRYQAAGLAWDAARLMPDDTEEKARLLCTAGSWLKDRDPEAADYFYKELVRRCRKTSIGALADRKRWFPELDASGNPIPWKPLPPEETNGPTEIAGIWYALNRGDTVQDLIDMARESHHIETTPAEIQQANPQINIAQLKGGVKILVPTQP